MQTRRSTSWIFLSLGIAVVSWGTTQSLLVTTLPIIQADLRTDASSITWTVTAGLIASAVATPLFGRGGDLFGKRRVLLAALAVIAIGAVLSAAAPSLAVLLIGQALQGIGAAVGPLAFGIVRDSLPPDRVPSGIAIVAALMTAAGVIGSVIAGPLAQALGWRGLFVVPFSTALIGGLLVRRTISESRERAPGGLNFPAALLMSAGLVALLIPLSMGGVWGWVSRPTIALFALAVMLLAGWVTVELRAREPLVDMRMMLLPGVWKPNVVMFLTGATMYGVWLLLARFLQEPVSTGYGPGASTSGAGLIMSPMLMVMPLAALLAGPATRFADASVQLVGSAALVSVATASMAAFHSGIWMLVVASVSFGIGMGTFFAAMSTVVVESVSAQQTGIATGLNANFRMIGGGVGTAMVSALIVTAPASGTNDSAPTETSYVVGFLVLAAMTAVAAIIASLGVRRMRRVSKVLPEL